MSTAHQPTSFDVQPGSSTMSFTREFDAPRDAVFRAHADPDLVRQWLVPKGTQIDIDHYDCRTGGSFRHLHLRGQDEYGVRGSFHEVDAPALIVQTFQVEGSSFGVSLERHEFVELPDGRSELRSTQTYESAEICSQVATPDMLDAIVECYDNLDEVLAGP